MNIIVNTQRFITAIRTAERVVAKNVTLPILQTVKIIANKNNLEILATNLEIGVRSFIGAKIQEEGEVAVPAKILSSFISNFTDETIILIANKQTITVKSSTATTRIFGMETDEFPIIPNVSDGIDTNMSSVELKNGLQAVVDATSISETRPELTGVYMQFKSNGVVFAATDSFRLSQYSISQSQSNIGSYIIPRPTVLEMIRILDDNNGDVKLTLSQSQIALKTDITELVSRLIDGHYPAYSKVIPEKQISSILINKSELEKTVRMSSIFSSNISDIVLIADKDTLTIEAKNSDKGDSNTQIKGEIEKDSFRISINYQYLLDGLKIIKAEKVVLGFTGDGSPLVLRGQGVENHIYVIMPLKT